MNNKERVRTMCKNFNKPQLTHYYKLFCNLYWYSYAELLK